MQMSAHDHHEGRGGSGPEAEGVTLSAGGYLLGPVVAPAEPAVDGELTFQLLDHGGDLLTDYVTVHDKELHLMVVRTDGTGYRHVHPVLDVATGTWSVPWRWDAAGTYRVFADFTPAGAGAAGVTLSRTVEVAGRVRPVTPELRSTVEVGGYTVSLDGDLPTDTVGDLRFTITRDGVPVTGLEPYLGAFGHLVALREGDLAYLHIHPEGDRPQPGDVGGPVVEFSAQAPSAGRYLLYLDFQVDGRVHTGEFVVDARG